jgi:hypothetical protein
MQALRRFPRGTACGASGLQVAHLLEATKTTFPHINSAVVAGITRLVGLLIKGKLTAALAPSLTLSPLHSPAQEGRRAVPHRHRGDLAPAGLASRRGPLPGAGC